MKTLRSILMLVVAVAATSACEKNAVGIIAEPVSGGANVKFFNFAVGSPAVNFFINNGKVTAVSATGCFLLDDANRQECLTTGRQSTSGVGYGSAGNGASAWYSDVPAGAAAISGRISAPLVVGTDTTPPNTPISNLQSNVEAGKFYSFYQSGIYNAATKTADSFIVEDVLPADRDFAVTHVRFVNATSTTQPMTLYVLNRVTQEVTAIGGEVAYKSASQFVALPESDYDLYTRVAGSTTNVFSRNQITFNGGRAYTITARGNTAVASTMLLDNTANR